jgi:beta-galactosidase
VTTGEGYSLKAEADKNNMSTNGTDVVHLKISVVDKNNIEVPTSNEKFKITIKGPAKLLSVDNGDPAFKGNFQSTEGSLFNGLALAVIQSQKEKGTISILIEGTNINKAETIIINSF